MLRIISVRPMNFNRTTYDFLDEKVVIRVKSSTAEYEDEAKYEDIKHIKIANSAQPRWIWLGLLVTLIPVVLSWIFSALGLPYHNNPIFLIIAKAIVFFGFILCIPAFHKNAYYIFLDQHRAPLITIKDDINNYEAIDQAVELVRQKSTIISDTNPEKPPPNLPPAFEHIDYDFKNYLKKSVTRFYEDKLIETKKSLVEEVVTEVNYSELSGKFLHFKTGDDGWFSLGLALLLFCGSAVSSVSLFLPQFFCGLLSRDILLLLIILPFLLFVISFFKRENILFLDANENLLYLMRPNSKNREKLETIVEYVKSKILLTDRRQS